MQKDILISVFTPTYNRAKYLPRLYQSLVKQDVRNFEWIIVDDGSTDNTEEVVGTFINEGKIRIIYKKQHNQGKHIAINRGLELAHGDWFLIIDSDDYLTNDALSTIYDYIAKNKGEDIKGFAFRRVFSTGKIIGGKFPAGRKEFRSNMVDRTVKYKIPGDMTEVFLTTLLRSCKFDEGIGEKFCAEGLMWNRTAKSGAELLYVDVPICICEYLPGGLTANSVKNRRKSPKYSTMVYRELAEISWLPIKYKLRAYINYWRFAFFLNTSLIDKIKDIKYSFWGICMFPIGFIMKIKDDLRLKK